MRDMMSAVEVTRKPLNNGLEAVLITLDGEDGMTLPEVVRVFGIPKETVISHVKSRGFKFERIFTQTLKPLRAENVIPLTGRPPRVVPRQAIESLVRFISTPETDEIYAQLWDTARAIFSPDAQKIDLGFGKPVEKLPVGPTLTLVREEVSHKAVDQDAMATWALSHPAVQEMVSGYVGTIQRTEQRRREVESKLDLIGGEVEKLKQEMEDMQANPDSFALKHLEYSYNEQETCPYLYFWATQHKDTKKDTINIPGHMTIFVESYLGIKRRLGEFLPDRDSTMYRALFPKGTYAKAEAVAQDMFTKKYGSICPREAVKQFANWRSKNRTKRSDQFRPKSA
jgi:hypothetical protein